MSAEQEAQTALAKLRGLRKLAARGMRVTKSENVVLNNLSPEALALVALDSDTLDNVTKLNESKGIQNGDQSNSTR